MSIIIKHIWRNIRSNSIRSFLIIFSLALSASVFYMNLNIGQDVYESSKLIMESGSKGYDLLITGDLMETPLALPACEKLRFFSMEDAVSEGRETKLLHCDIDLCLKEDLIRVDRALSESQKQGALEAYISRASALFFGYQLGDTVPVITDTGFRDYKLVGLIESMGPLPQCDEDILQLLVKQSETDPINVAIAALRQEDDIDGVCDELSDRYENLSITTLHGTSDKRMNSIREVLSILLLLVIGISFYVIFSTSSLIIDYRIPVLGVFRSVGASKRSTNAILLGESAAYGLLAAIPGMALGEVIRNMVRTTTLSMGMSTANVRNLMLVPVFTVGMNLIISAFSIAQNGNPSVQELLSRRQSSAAKPPKVLPFVGLAMTFLSIGLAWWNQKYLFPVLVIELLLGLVGISFMVGGACWLISYLLSRFAKRHSGGPVWLGIKSLGINKINRSTALLVTTVVTVVALVYVCVGSIGSFFDQYQKNYPYDIMIRGAVGEEDSFDYLQSLQGVSRVTFEYWQFSNVTINGENIRICAAAKDGFSNGIEAEGNMIQRLVRSTCLVDRLFASMHGYEIGDVLKVRTGENAESDLILQIVGFCESNVFNSARNTIVMTREDYFKGFKSDPAIIGIRTRYDIPTMIAAINDAVAENTGGTFRVRSTTDHVDSELGDAMNAVKAVSAIPFLTVILALFGLINNQLIGFNQKKTQYAILYSVAMNRGQLSSAVFAELLSTFGVGCLMGALMSVWLAKIMRDVLFACFSYMPLAISAGQIIEAVLLVMGMLCLTAISPLRRLKKMDVIKEIKYE